MAKLDLKSQSPLKNGVSASKFPIKLLTDVYNSHVSIPSEKRGLCKGTALTHVIACEICRFA